MSYDELELDKLGDEKSALFFLISDTDTTYNFLVALAFSQMFNLLCERADNTYGGRLPYHVRVLWDEAANTGQVPGLEKIVAVIRSREISLTLFYQAMSQCKALYNNTPIPPTPPELDAKPLDKVKEPKERRKGRELER